MATFTVDTFRALTQVLAFGRYLDGSTITCSSIYLSFLFLKAAATNPCLSVDCT